MKSNRKPEQEPEQVEPAFVMKDGDRFYSILSSNPIKYDQVPDTETVMVFFVIRRASGLIDIFHVIKTFEGAQCVGRHVQSKLGISETSICVELDAIKTHFIEQMKAASDITIAWNEIDLSKVTDRNEQVRRIQAWNRLNVYKFPDFSLN
jgi:hypothetical protein